MTRAELNTYVDTQVTNKTTVNSLTPTNEGNAIKAVADYVDDNKEDFENKSTDVETDGASNVKYPSVKAVKDYVDQEIATVGSPYKSYVALITHGAGNGDPTAQVLHNTLGGLVTWAYEDPNNYGASSAGLFTLNKTVVFVSSPQNPLMKVGASSNNANFVGLTTENDGFANVAIEIRVYP